MTLRIVLEKEKRMKGYYDIVKGKAVATSTFDPYGYVRIAAATPKITVADPEENRKEILRIIEEANKQGVSILVFPELCLSGYTCADLFHQMKLIEGVKDSFCKLVGSTYGYDILIAIGLPFMKQGKLYNVMALVHNGKILGMIPKTNIPNYSEFYEQRHFVPGNRKTEWITLNDSRFPFGTDILFKCQNIPGLIIAGEICEDLWVPCPPSIRHSLNGATLILNASASNDVVGKADYRRNLVSGQSARLICAYAYASAGEGESTQDLIFGGHNLIAENGSILAESERFQNQMIITDIDVEKIIAERSRMTTFEIRQDDYEVIDFSFNSLKEEKTIRKFNKSPFVPSNNKEKEKRCEEILTMQALGLKKRLEHTCCKKAVIGVSGGLDSTLALLVTVRAFDMLGMPRDGIIGITMPCFGTTDRTRDNSWKLMEKTGITKEEIVITKSVTQHLYDIGHGIDDHDITYENAQARERTQVLMDVANKENGLVVGTGDMSELALGWCTYNGDHMSMYAVNAGVPKTLVKHLVSYYAENCDDEAIHDVLMDILETPVSPELLPPDENGEIAQKTEDKIGPYELHDFFIYQVLRFGFTPRKVYDMAVKAFEEDYEKKDILKWMKVFYKRFFSQQFKRSCLPDGPKIGTVSVSPRGDLRMPSDASARLWLEELEKIEEKS